MFYFFSDIYIMATITRFEDIEPWQFINSHDAGLYRNKVDLISSIPKIRCKLLIVFSP